MGEFDLSLIREFRSRPALYDRGSPLFKDKIHTGHEWQEISNKLGFDVSLLKDRMLQLRNRYNLEKRRLEQLRDENPGELFESPWPLYEQLHFLSDHIRARRSYKRLLPLQPAVEMEKSNSQSNSTIIQTAASVAPFANDLLTVKMEEEENDTDEPESESPSASDNDSRNLANTSATRGSFVTMPSTQRVSMGAPNSPHVRAVNGSVPSITIRRLNTSTNASSNNSTAANKTTASSQKRFAITSNGNIPQQRHHHHNNHNHNHNYQQHQHQHQHQRQPQTHTTDLDSDATHVDVQNTYPKYAAPPPTKKLRPINVGEHKYAAFGDFMSSSLLELPAQKALLLVEKFTSELVKVLIHKSSGDGENDDINAQTAINGK